MKNRKDGIRVRNIDGMHSLMVYVKPLRADSDVYINTTIDVTNLIEYIEKLKKKEETKHITYFHAFSIAAGKLIYNRPLMNRFIINKKYYDRKDVTISFVAKREFTDEAEENFSVIKVDEKDNIFTLSHKISGQVKKVRTSSMNSADKFMDTIGKLPGFIKKIIVFFLKFADNHDLIPESLTNDSIYHSSLLMSNLGSIGCDSIYHNLTDFGTNSILMTIGRIKEVPSVVNGKVVVRKVCDFGVNIDERIADGFYFVKSLKLFEYILNNPKLLENDANTKIEVVLKK